MVWLVRAKSVPLKMRDMSTGIMRTVASDWISFGALPPGVDPVNDTDLEYLHQADAAIIAAASGTGETVETVSAKRGRGRPRKVIDGVR